MDKIVIKFLYGLKQFFTSRISVRKLMMGCGSMVLNQHFTYTCRSLYAAAEGNCDRKETAQNVTVTKSEFNSLPFLQNSKRLAY